jgi:spore maturation protein SpmB
LLPEMNIKKIQDLTFNLLKETWLTSWELIRIIVPVAVVTKGLDELGVIALISTLFEPLMALVGLPGSLGLVWATGMLTSLYGGLAVFATLAPGLDLTSTQITVLCSAMLIAHSLPIELSVSKRAGANVMPILLLRVFGALAYAFLLNQFCLAFGLWEDVPVLIFKASDAAEGYLAWGLDLLTNLFLIVGIIFAIIISMKILRIIGVLGVLERLLAPILPLFGMGQNAAPLTVVGMVMGIGYGGALIIRETATGKLGKDEVFYSMALMGLCHGLVEDTLIMVAMGGKIGGILFGRVAFSLIVTYLLVRLHRLVKKQRLHPGV